MAIINRFVNAVIPSGAGGAGGSGMAQNVATIHNGAVRNTGFSIEDLVVSMTEYMDAVFEVKNETTGEVKIGNLGETIADHMIWRKMGHKIIVTKLTKETAAILYGKK